MPESKGLQHPQGDNPEGRQGQVQPRPPLQPQRLGLLEQVHPFDPAGGSANIQPAAVRMERRCRSADQDASIGRIPAWGGGWMHDNRGRRGHTRTRARQFAGRDISPA